MQRSYAENKQVVFGGDGYSEEWHAEAERRGLLNLPSTPDALPYLISDDTVTAFSNYGVLSERELHARYEVFLEQYVTKLNIEAETAASIARTMLLPAAVRYKAELLGAEEPELANEVGELISSFIEEIRTLDSANLKENTPEDTLEEHARYMHDVVFTAMGRVRDVADQLEKAVADDLWPLPKYSEILFIK
jgi:glutamine synthetase